MATTYYTYTKGEIWSKSLNACVCEAEASSPNCVVVGLEDEWNDIRNATNKKAHESLQAAQDYAEALSNAEYDRRQLAKEQGI